MDGREIEGYFQPFRSSFAEGTGLGAAIVYRIVQEHGGNIRLDSSPGRGTRVRVFLPRWRGAHAEAATPEPRRAHGGARW